MVIHQRPHKDMQFWIQAGNPAKLNAFNASDSTLDEAIETVFPLRTEYAFMAWHAISIPLSYKYDLSCLMLDVIILCEEILKKTVGEKTIFWPSNTFQAEWHIKWSETTIKIHPNFESVIGSIENELNALPDVEISKIDFLCEWKLPLQQITKALRESGYTSTQIPDLLRMERLIEQTPQPGMLYRSNSNRTGY